MVARYLELGFALPGVEIMGRNLKKKSSSNTARFGKKR